MDWSFKNENKDTKIIKFRLKLIRTLKHNSFLTISTNFKNKK